MFVYCHIVFSYFAKPMWFVLFLQVDMALPPIFHERRQSRADLTPQASGSFLSAGGQKAAGVASVATLHELQHALDTRCAVISRPFVGILVLDETDQGLVKGALASDHSQEYFFFQRH